MPDRILMWNLSTRCCRSFSSSARAQSCNRQVRVRFAPSPTGHIHLGGLRAALYNFIFAKQNNGQFILRIEDTDRSRIVPGSADEIEEVLHWAKLDPDESPKKGGPFGPYFQSERLQLYLDRANELLDKGKAYMCFCSPTRLELLRKYQARNREKPHYDGKCRHLSPGEIKEKLDGKAEDYVIRFALQEGETVFKDLVFGDIRNDLVAIKESDPIILKSDRFPTYHFANVVDDNAMQITNVIRGVEWLSSTAKHIQLYEAFDWSPPQYMHFPLITMEDGGKMSKRNNHSHVIEYIKAGYCPTTLLNFLTNTGGGVPKRKQDSMDLWTLDELIKGFDFRQMTSHGGSLDPNRLKIYSQKEHRKRWIEEPEGFMKEFHQLLKENHIDCDLDDKIARTIISNLINRITNMKDLLSVDYMFIWRQPELSWCKQVYQEKNWNLEKIIQETIETIKLIDLNDRGKLSKSLKGLAEIHQLEYSDYMKLLRLILSNDNKGPPLHEMAQSLGKPRLLSYLERGLAYVSETNK